MKSLSQNILNSFRHRIIIVLMLLTSSGSALGAITCSVSSPGWTSSYFPATATVTTGSSTVTINCTRAIADPTTQTYSLSANNGLNPQGQNNRAANGVNLIKYNEFQNATLATLWSPNSPFAGTINFGANTSASITIVYYYGINAGQAVPAGTYTDTVTMTLTYGAATATATHPVAILVSPTCTITTAPGAMTFSYAAMQAAPAAASTSFSVTCTNLLPYTAGLDLYTVTDAAVSLTYTMNVGQTIRPAGSVYTAGVALSVTGTGLAQTISVDGTIAGGQAGQCNAATCTNAASANRTRTITITY